MADSASNVSVSLPLQTNMTTEVFMNGFAWSAEGGLFIPLGENEALLNEPQQKIEFNR